MRQQRADVASFVCGQAREHVLQVSERIMAVEFG